MGDTPDLPTKSKGLGFKTKKRARSQSSAAIAFPASGSGMSFSSSLHNLTNPSSPSPASPSPASPALPTSPLKDSHTPLKPGLQHIPERASLGPVAQLIGSNRPVRSPSAPDSLADTPLGLIRNYTDEDGSSIDGGSENLSEIEIEAGGFHRRLMSSQSIGDDAEYVRMHEQDTKIRMLKGENVELRSERDAYKERARRAEMYCEKLKTKIQEEVEDVVEEEDFGDEHDFDAADGPTNIVWGEIEEGQQKPLPVSATLDKLVEKLTEPQTDPAFVEIFFLTFRSFCSPMALLNKLINRYAAPPPRDVLPFEMQDFLEKNQSMIRLRVCNALKQWLEKYYDDFSDELINHTLNFLDFTVSKSLPAMAEKLKRIVHRTSQKVSVEVERKAYMAKMQAILKEKKQLERKMDDYKNSLSARSTPPSPILPKGYRMHLGFMEWDPLEIARQISMIECDMYMCLQPKEFLNQAWNGDKAPINAPHLYNLIQRFNDTSLWVGTLVLEKDKLPDRVKVLQRFIDLLEHLRSQNNHNGMMEIASGLRGMAVRRLRKTWDELPKKCKENWDEICKLIAPEQNHKKVRETFPGLLPPKMPFVGLFLSDLTFIEQGNKNRIGEHNLINFKKRAMVTKTIRQIQLYQTMAYQFEIVPDLHQYLMDMEFLDEETLYRKSIEFEPRETSQRRSTMAH